MGRSFRLQGPLAWVGIGLAAVLALALVVWLLTTVWIFLLGAGLVAGVMGMWRRLQFRRYGFGPRRWRKVTPGSTEAIKPMQSVRFFGSKDSHHS